MSWGTCYSGSNNIHFNFPPIMNDGRNYSSWQPEAIINERIRKAENIKSNWDYRRFLTNNATQIMKYNNQESCYYLGLNPHTYTDKTPSSNVPFMYTNTTDTNAPGFGYPTSDLKNVYLSREQLQTKMISPSINMSEIPPQNSYLTNYNQKN
jgi:hypothetical protein